MLLPKLLDFRSDMGVGISPDKHPLLDTFFWDTGRNVKFTPNGVKKMTGWTEITTALGTDPVRGLNQLLNTSGQNIFWGDVQNLWRWDSSTVSNVASGFTGALNESVTQIATSWSFVEWGNWMVASNGVDPIQVWKGSGNFVPLGGGPPATAEILVKKDVNIIAFNTDDGETTYEWCHQDDIEDWVVAADKTAGFNTIRDFDSAIIAAVPLGGEIAVYSIDRMVLVGTRNPPYYFGHSPGIKGIGAVSKYSVVEVGRFHYGVSRKGFFKTDGVTHSYLDVDDIRETFLDEVNWDQKSKINGYHDERNTEVIWSFCTESNLEPNKSIGYNYEQDVWTLYDFGFTSTQEQRIFDYAVLADVDGSVYWGEFSDDAAGEILSAYIRSKPYSFMEARGSTMVSLEDYFKYIQAVKLGLKRHVGDGVYLKLGFQDELDEPITWFTYRYINKDVEPVYPGKSTRWLTIEVGSDRLGDAWELHTMSVHGKRMGSTR